VARAKKLNDRNQLIMKITSKSKKSAGLTFTECMIAIVVLAIIVIGTSAYRYAAATSARKSELQMTGAEAGLLLCESWCALEGSGSFDPVADFSGVLDIQTSGTGPATPSGFTALASYSLDIDETVYFATLSWKDIATGLRALHVEVAWDQHSSGSEEYEDANKTFNLTTYTRI